MPSGPTPDNTAHGVVASASCTLTTVLFFCKNTDHVAAIDKTQELKDTKRPDITNHLTAAASQGLCGCPNVYLMKALHLPSLNFLPFKMKLTLTRVASQASTLQMSQFSLDPLPSEHVSEEGEQAGLKGGIHFPFQGLENWAWRKTWTFPWNMGGILEGARLCPVSFEPRCLGLHSPCHHTVSREPLLLSSSRVPRYRPSPHI